MYFYGILRNLLHIIILAFSFSAVAQSSQLSIGPVISSNGYGLASHINLKQFGSHCIGGDLSISTLRHPNEYRVVTGSVPITTSYIPGKQRRALQINSGLSGSQQLAMGRQNWQLNVNWSTGPSIAWLRPVLVYHYTDRSEQRAYVLDSYQEAAASTQAEIIDDAGWFRGFSESQLKLGYYASGALEWVQTTHKRTHKIQLGISFARYSSTLALMAGSENKAFTTLFCSYQIGK